MALHALIVNAIILSATIAVFAGCAHRPATGSFTYRELAGHYWASEGDSRTIELRMQRDGRYAAIWHGCLGTYGTATGRWRVEEQAVVFIPTEETEMMRGDLRRLSARRVGGEVVMVHPRWEHLFGERDPILSLCYRKGEDR